jgi:hypothetical protein
LLRWLRSVKASVKSNGEARLEWPGFSVGPRAPSVLLRQS